MKTNQIWNLGKGKFYVICMSFDGEYQKEPYKFNTIDEAWEYANTLGSKWYFYPYSFVCSGKTIKDCGYGLTHLENKRITTIQKVFRKVNDENEGLNAEEFWFKL